MALNVKIDFNDLYETIQTDADQRSSVFDSTLENGEVVRLGVRISSNAHPLMPNVYNLAFGPIDQNGQISDKAKLTHQNYSKVFSTVISEGLSFLDQHPEYYLGIDGSNMARAYMYYRCIQNNFYYLSSFLSIFGVNYYIRILRQEEDGTDLDNDDIITIPKEIDAKELVTAKKLYNYFIFKYKQDKNLLSAYFKK